MFSKFKISGVSLKELDFEEKLIFSDENFHMDEIKDIFGESHEHFKEFNSNIKPFYVRSIKNGICRTNKEEVYTSENQVIKEFTSQEENPKVGRWKLPKSKIKKINGKVAHLSLAGLENNYYHWLVECLGRLYLIEKSGFNPDFYVISQNFEFKREYAKLLKIPEEKIIPAESNQIIQADELIVADFINNWEFIDFRGYQHYQKQYLPSWIGNLYKERILPEIEKTEPKRIYISRAKAKYRKILNFDEILPILKKYDFQIVYPEDINVREQLKLFYNASIIVSPMGAGLGNIVFSKEGTKILELCPQYFHTSCLRILANVMELDYNYMVGKTEDTSMHPQQENFVLDAKKFEQALEKICEEF